MKGEKIGKSTYSHCRKKSIFRNMGYLFTLKISHQLDAKMFSMLRGIPLAKINDVCFVERTVIFCCKVFYAIMPSYIKQENHILTAHFSLRKINLCIEFYKVM